MADIFNANPGAPDGASRRQFMRGAAAVALVGAGSRHAAAAAAAGGHSASQIALRDAANLAASIRRATPVANSYQPLDAGIVHFFGYGESLSGGFYGVPLLSTSQPYDNLMIGGSTRAVDDKSSYPASTTWTPFGEPDSDGVYPFNPMIATLQNGYTPTSGETPGEGAMNFFRRSYLQHLGQPSNSACRFVLTNCGIGGKTIAQLSKGADPEIFNRLRNAATYVKQTATSLGLSYQVGGVLWTDGESDCQFDTSYASYLTSLKRLQHDFLTDIVQTIAGQADSVTVPWFSDQPAAKRGGVQIFQALLDWANTPGSNFFLAGPVYQYPDHSVHLTANGYRWHGNQLGKSMTGVLLEDGAPAAVYLTGATVSGTSVLVDFNVPSPPLIQGDSYMEYVKTLYPGLGLVVADDLGVVPIVSAAIVGAATVQIILGRTLSTNPGVQAGYDVATGYNWGTNICDSNAAQADDIYVYVSGEQDPGEDITTWNGAPLVNHRYPLNNYLAIGQIAITAG